MLCLHFIVDFIVIKVIFMEKKMIKILYNYTKRLSLLNKYILYLIYFMK
jgi:hypothetical protein